MGKYLYSGTELRLDNIFTFSFIGISQSLATTSYIKMVEVWMIFTMTFPFIEVLLHTYKERIRNSIQLVNSNDYKPSLITGDSIYFDYANSTKQLQHHHTLGGGGISDDN